MASSTDPPTRSTLPNEILSHILSYLDVAPPSASTSTLLDEPNFDLTRAPDAPLKSSSRVSKRWREVTLTRLFKHAQFKTIDEKGEKAIMTNQIQPFLSFVTGHELGKVISSLTLITYDQKLSNTSDGKYEPDCFASFWQLLFAVIDPTVLVIVAHPQALGALTSCNVPMLDAWHFNCGCHYFRLERPVTKSKSDSEPDRGTEGTSGSEVVTPDVTEPRVLEDWELPRAVTSALFSIRNWTKILLNEGSFIRGYATYEWWLRQPPSILEDMLGAGMPLDYPLISPTIRDFSFIGIFPMNNHFAAITEKFPLLDNIYVQLVPRNDILQDRVQMRQVEAEDLWTERNSCYAILMRELFHSPPRGNFQQLKTFESGDAADEAAWNMAVEYVKRARNGWKVAGEGIFVKNPAYVRDATDAEDDHASILSVPQP